MLWNIITIFFFFKCNIFITKEFSGYFDKYKFQKNSIYATFVNVFAVTFDEINASLQNKND